ncbi:MAG: hypothetical protein ACRC2K_00410 [Clostridium sp.]
MAQNKLYRNFIILQEHERIEATDKAQSGYAKIEARAEKCKITFYTQNLKDDKKYYMVLICNKKDLKQIVNLGPLPVSTLGKGECSKEYLIDNIAGLNMGYEKISGAGVYTEQSGEKKYVLYGFINGEQGGDNWTKMKVVEAIDDEMIIKEKPQEKKEKSKENKHINKEEHKKSSNDEDECDESEGKKKQDDKDTEHHGKKKEEKSNFDEYEEKIEEESDVDPDNFKLRGALGEYFEGIVDEFREVKGNFKDIKYCKWYKVPINDLDDMCHITNYNKYTVAYYPMINYFPYIKKYGHFMLGYKCDSKGNLKYLVYGVPGKKDRDEQPYSGKTGFVTWVNNNDEEVGCWIMFYDFKNCNIVVPMQ